MSEQEHITIAAQPGPQWQALESHADILIFGGSAGGGKTLMLLLEMLKWIRNPQFRGVIFRRESPQITKEGGLWDTSQRFFPGFGGQGVEGKLLWRFGSGATIGFDHLQLERDVEKWQGSQIPAIFFDELVHFSERQVFYMMSRNRSASGIPGYIRATCNPDPDSWVAKFISWWIDLDTGYAIPERSGVLRWFVRIGEALVWADTKEELIATYGADQMPKSVTFIPSLVTDNKILMKEDPTYISSLMALPAVDRARLLKGNWKVRASAGMAFKRSWFEVVPFSAVPMNGRTLRSWDKASTVATPENPDPDWSVGLKVRFAEGIFWVMHMERFRDRPHGVKNKVKALASSDGTRCEVLLEGDPGSAGDFETSEYITWLAGYIVKTRKPTKAKYERAKPAMTQAEGRKIKLVGDVSNPPTWHDELLTELENFGDDPDSYAHDDICFTSNTCVLTSDSWKPIYQIQPGEMVMTRRGLQKVLWSGQTGIKRVITRYGLTGTPNHPVWTQNRGWVRLALLMDTDVMVCVANPYFSMAGFTIATQIQKQLPSEDISTRMINGRSHHGHFTEMCGSFLMDHSRQGCMSTTRKELMTIGRPSLSHAQHWNMADTTNERPINCRSINELGHKITEGNAYLKRKYLSPSFVRFVETISRLPPSRENFVLIPAHMLRSSPGEKLNGRFKRPVFNIKVAIQNEFFANGILVHNCDTLANAVNELALPTGGFTSPDGIRVGQHQNNPFSIDRLSPADLGLA